MYLTSLKEVSQKLMQLASRPLTRILYSFPGSNLIPPLTGTWDYYKYRFQTWHTRQTLLATWQS